MAAKHDSFPVVGIGASAGGLEAFQAFLGALPDDAGMAYVVVQHLDPRRESLLPELLARVTHMPVHEAREGMEVAVNQIYVIAPNTDMTLGHGRLQLVPRTEMAGLHLSIDTFLRSLARSRTTGAMGVILSGTASDGTLGLQAIKDEGGMTFVQDPASAQFAAMPQSAITAGSVDFIGSPEAIARELARISHHPYVRQTAVAQITAASASSQLALFNGREPEFPQVVRLLSRQTGTDFTAYKPTMLHRRIQRRMALAQIDHIAPYLAYLSDRPEEVKALYQDMLIGVTSFFRDTITFETLQQKVLPLIVAEKATHAPLRVWVPGCSTGQEVYSLAICILEFLAAHALSTSLQLFGTDLNAQAIEYARAGFYPAEVIDGLSLNQIARFFDAIDGGYHIRKEVRDLCVFALHDVLKDPPFSRIDVLSCQNVLIYLDLPAQKKVLQSFHYALLPQGVLLLSPAETIGSATSLFALLEEQKRQWYGKKVTGKRTLLNPSRRDTNRERTSETDEEEINKESEERKGTFNLQHEIDSLLARFAPVSVVVNAEMEILHFRGDTNPYLRSSPGRASLNLFKMARAGLDLELRTTLSQAKKSGQTVKKAGIQFDDQGMLRDLTLEIIPIKASPTERYFMVLFAEASAPVIPLPVEQGKRRGSKDQRMQQLARQLEATREEMRRIIEEAEAAYEELHSANEEGLSTNEELQSLNEELETSKEEIQASNEELLVVNRELKQSNTELYEAREYADAIVETIREPLLVLNADLHVQRANRAFYQFFRVEPAHIEHYLLFDVEDRQWDIPALRTLLEDLLPTNHSFTDYTMTYTFPRIGPRTMLLNAQRIDHVPLILLAMEDITALTLAVQEKHLLLSQREDFMAIASHELKTPLTALKGYTQLLHHRLHTSGDEVSVSMLAKMNSRLNTLVALINELLDVTAIEAGKLQWRPEVFDLDALVRTCIEEMGLTTQQQIHIEGTLGTLVRGNPEQSSQVLINLLTNAIKYSPQSTSIVVLLRVEKDAAIVGVQDFGIGIASEKQSRLFERFFRVSGPESTMVPGLGLGLYISAEIVKRQGGRIWVESQSGRGSTFFFTVPFASETPTA